MPSTVNLKASGLVFQPNPLELPPGSLLEASNVVIRRDNIIESRRGFKIYGEDFGSVSDRAKQLMEYKDRILRHYGTTLQFDTNTQNSDFEELFSTFAGTYEETEEGLRIKYIESNGNLYLTTADGVKKISARTASDFVTTADYITQAGGIKAVDLSARLNYTFGSQTDFFTQNSVVAYRVVWGTRDANNNLILGAPSSRVEIYNPMTPLMLQDYARLLSALDAINQSGSLITDGDYVNTLKLESTASANELLTNLQTLVAKLDNDIYYANDTGAGVPFNITTVIDGGANVYTVNFSAGTATDYFAIGSKVKLSGFTTTTGTINGNQVLTAVGATSITFTSATAATGNASVIGDIKSNEYEYITAPAAPSTPPTGAQLLAVQDYLSDIIVRLQTEPIGVISSVLLNAYIIPLDVTTSSTVLLDITIPNDVTANYFYQVYRTAVNTATGATILSDISAGDEMGLVYEAYPTSAELIARELTVEDITPDSFRGANLYTNPSTGEGILQANEVPPFAKDINRFKNVIFYANTRTKHRKSLALLGVENMIADYNNSITPKITITNGTTTNTYSFVTGRAEETDLTCIADVANSLNGDYFRINSANNTNLYYVWFKTSGGAVSDPSASNVGRTGIRVDVTTGSTATQVAEKVRDKLAEYNTDFATESLAAVVTIFNIQDGYADDLDVGTSGFSRTVVTQGRGENAATNEVLLSTATSPAIAVDETARSLVRIINQNTSEANYAYYLSGANDVPGKFLIEARGLDENPIYFLANNATTGASFNPDLSPTGSINSITMANPTVITTTAAHGMINGETVVISNSNSTPSIDGAYEITYLSATTFSIPVNVTVAGTSAVFSRGVDTEGSSNEEKANRIYYSKIQQPEAVPILNYFDVGSEDDEILRIYPLRDTLFVFKQHGLYRISGESAPFNLSLFDSSVNLIASDSLAVVKNILYCWTDAGINGITEGGADVISRPIDTEILKLGSEEYTNFRTATWGIGYESDNSYTVYTVSSTSDELATVGYRYSVLTNSWTTIDKTATCGIVPLFRDKMYLGAGDVNYIEQERKTFNRYDYADREITSTLSVGNYNDTVIRLGSVTGIEEGDVLVQEQLVNTTSFNIILKKLDSDSGVTDTDYYSSLVVSGGSSIRTSLENLATKLDADTGVADTNYAATIASVSGTIASNSADAATVITDVAHGLFTGRSVSISGSNSTPSIDGIWPVTVISANTFSIPVTISIAGTAGSWTTITTDFRDIKACFNKVVTKINADTGVAFSNYPMSTVNTIQEAVITNVNSVTKNITVNMALDYVVGPLTIFKAIETSFTYAPATMGDVLNFKHISEATMMFINKAFTNATLSFASDLLPDFIDIEFNGDGNGIFGHSIFGTGFFGGASNSAPFRTYIPRNKQRCRYLVCKFSHKIAREEFAVVGTTLTGEITPSSRAYR